MCFPRRWNYLFNQFAPPDDLSVLPVASHMTNKETHFQKVTAPLWNRTTNQNGGRVWLTKWKTNKIGVPDKPIVESAEENAILKVIRSNHKSAFWWTGATHQWTWIHSASLWRSDMRTSQLRFKSVNQQFWIIGFFFYCGRNDYLSQMTQEKHDTMKLFATVNAW